MLSECLHYQGKAGYFLIEFLKWYFLKYWQVRTRPVFAQTVTIYNGITFAREFQGIPHGCYTNRHVHTVKEAFLCIYS